MNLRYDLEDATYAGVTKSPALVVKSLGITWECHINQTLGNQIWFMGCNGTTDKLPSYITIMEA